VTEWIDNVVFWHWWILAGLLLIIELTVPAFFFLWLGIAAGLTGLILLVFPELGIESQLILFAILSIVAVIAWRRYREISVPESDQPHLNRRGSQYVGREFTLEAPIINGLGKVDVDDSTWRIRGPNLPAGSQVRVTRVDGVVLVVEPAR
jgi:membrane protein implicated in regulation of membrane protease activity